MSAKPYIVQQDSPNLVIVPTGTYYEPPPKKVKQDSVQNLPTPTKKLDNSAFTKKTAAKLNYSGRSINNDVLIDVSKVKKPPASWASNFLQSIGGTSPKFARLYSSAPKLMLRKDNTQLNTSEEIILSHTTNNQLNTNAVEIQTIMDKEKSLPKINLNRINPKQNKPAPQSIPPKVNQTRKPEVYTKENSQPHSNTKTYQSKSDTTTTQAQVRKEPSLPKGYRIPIQSKNKKQVSEPILDINPTRPNTLKESDQVNHNAKCQGTDQPKYNKPATQDMISNRERTLFKRIKETNNVKINKTETNQDKDSIKRIRLINEYHTKKIDELKAKNTTSQLRIKKYIPKQNEEINLSKRNKETAHSKTCKENNQLKNDDKEMKQRKTKEINLPRSYKNPFPPENHNEITCHKSDKESALAKNMKTIAKQNNKKEVTYSTKLKTKKCSEMSKSTKHNKSKHTLESESKKHKNHSELNIKGNFPKTINESVKESPLNTPGTVASKKENILKLKKSSTEKYNKNKKYTQYETNTKTIKMSKSNNDERSSKSISPIKSVVKKLKIDHNVHDKERRHHKESDFHSHDNETSGQDFNYNSHKNNSKKYLHKDSDVDLRAKLKRKIAKNCHQEDPDWDRDSKKNKFATVPNGDRFVPDENLIISFDAKDDNEEVTSSLLTEKMPPNKKLARKKSAGGKKCKKIKLQINIVFDHADTTDEESIKSEEHETNTEIAENMDFSFLDDFNVDEIVKSLNECKDSSKQDHSEVQLTVNDAKAEGLQTNDCETNYIEAVTTSQSNALTNNNETKSEIAYPNVISSVEHKTNEHKEMESQPEVTQTRHRQEVDIELKADKDRVKNAEQAEHVQSLAVFNDAVVKKEEGTIKTIEGNTKLHVNDNSQNSEGQTASLAFVANLFREHTIEHVKTEVDIGQGTDLAQIKNSQDIKLEIASNEVPVEMSTTENISQSNIKNENMGMIPMDISQDNIINDSGQGSVLNEPTLTKLENNIELLMKNIINDDSEDTSKRENKIDTNTNNKIGVIQTQTSVISVIEPHVIIILDSDDEDETQIKNNQSTKDNCATTLECSMESSIDVESDEVIILDAISATVNSEPILVLDADDNVGIKSSDAAKNQLKKINKKINTENLTLAENEENVGIKIDANVTTKCEKIALENTSTKNITTKPQNVNTKEVKAQDKNSASNSENINADEAYDKTVIKTSEELPKSPKKFHVAPEKSIPKAVPPNAKPQNLNKKEIKAQDKNSPANSENINADEANEKTCLKTSEELPKPPEKFHVAPEKSIPKAVPPNAKPQNVNTKEIKAQDKDSPENSKNINAVEANDKTAMKTSEVLPKPPVKFHVASEKSMSIPKAVPPNAKPQNVNTKEIKAQDKESPANGENKKANEVNDKTVIKTHVAHKNSIPKAASPNAKPQNVNTKEVKAQDKKSPSNSENIHKVTKTKDINAQIEICHNIANDVFIKRLENKLLSVTGQKYTITKLIRDGRFSKIYACKDPALCDFALKMFKNGSKDYCLQKQTMIIELQNGVPENNLNCVRLVECFPVWKLWCFLMEYYPKTLAEALNENNKSFHIDEVQNLSRQLVSAVTILRNNNIIHSDIKPSHILINASNTRIKLCGFDQASYFDGRKMFPNTGTVNYRAPELILGYQAAYGIDVWSTALVMYEMATNRKLFPGTFNNDILFKQLCTIGSVPLEMLMQSSYRNMHFKGTSFCRIIGKKSIIIHHITGNDFLNNGLFQTYDKDWAKKKSPAVRLQDKSKLCAFSKLLHSMLAMFPRNRIAIEFVFANPFIYETFDNC